MEEFLIGLMMQLMSTIPILELLVRKGSIYKQMHISSLTFFLIIQPFLQVFHFLNIQELKL